MQSVIGGGVVHGLVEIKRIGQYGIKPLYRHSCPVYVKTGAKIFCKSCSTQTVCANAGKNTDRLIHCAGAPVDLRWILGERKNEISV